MDINSLNTAYLNSVSKNAKSSGSKIDSTLKSDLSKASDDELMDVCKQFEAYFTEQIFKNMEQALVPKSEMSDGANETLVDFYKSKLFTEYSTMAADQSSTGLAQMLYEQMKRNYGTADIPSATQDSVDESDNTVEAVDTDNVVE